MCSRRNPSRGDDGGDREQRQVKRPEFPAQLSRFRLVPCQARVHARAALRHLIPALYNRLVLALALLAAFQFQYEAPELVNAVYNLACLTGKIACSQPIYRKFWEDTLHVTPNDGAQFDKFSDILLRAEKAAPDYPHVQLLPNYTSYYPSLKVRRDLLIIALDGPSPEAVEKRAASLVGPQDAAALKAAIEHTIRRLHDWYAVNSSSASQSAKGIRAHLDKRTSLMQDAARFTEAKFASPRILVHALPSPAPAGDDATATVIGNHVTIEITNRMEGEGIASIVLHELTHALYDSADWSVHREVIHQFVSQDGAAIPAVYSLLNEAIATSVQLISQDAQPTDDRDVYRHPYIPRAARATVPVLKSAMAQHKTIRQGFVPEYVAAMQKELGGEAKTIRFELLSAALFASDANATARDAFLQQFRTLASVQTPEEAKHFEMMPQVRLVTYDEADRLASIPEVASLKKNRAFLYQFPGGQKWRHEFVFAGRDLAALTELINAVGKSTISPSGSILFTIEETAPAPAAK